MTMVIGLHPTNVPIGQWSRNLLHNASLLQSSLVTLRCNQCNMYALLKMRSSPTYMALPASSSHCERGCFQKKPCPRSSHTKTLFQNHLSFILYQIQYAYLYCISVCFSRECASSWPSLFKCLKHFRRCLILPNRRSHLSVKCRLWSKGAPQWYNQCHSTCDSEHTALSIFRSINPWTSLARCKGGGTRTACSARIERSFSLHHPEWNL